MNRVKISFHIYFSLFLLFVLFFSYTPVNIRNKMIYSCLRLAKENCNSISKSKAKLILEQCKVFVIHKQDLSQIKNSYHCKKKKD